MFASILLLFFLPWIDSSPVRSGKYRPTFRIFFGILILDILVLGWCGGSPATPGYVINGQIAELYYFAHFLIILPTISRTERTRPFPNSITDAVLGTKDRIRACEGKIGVDSGV